MRKGLLVLKGRLVRPALPAKMDLRAHLDQLDHPACKGLLVVKDPQENAVCLVLMDLKVQRARQENRVQWDCQDQRCVLLLCSPLLILKALLIQEADFILAS